MDGHEEGSRGSSSRFPHFGGLGSARLDVTRIPDRAFIQSSVRRWAYGLGPITLGKHVKGPIWYFDGSASRGIEAGSHAL